MKLDINSAPLLSLHLNEHKGTVMSVDVVSLVKILLK